MKVKISKVSGASALLKRFLELRIYYGRIKDEEEFKVLNLEK